MKTFESFQWHIPESCKRRCRVRSGSALELQMEENFCPKDFTVRISNFGIHVCLIFFLRLPDLVLFISLSVFNTAQKYRKEHPHYLSYFHSACETERLEGPLAGSTEIHGKTHTDSTRSRIKFQGCMSTFFWVVLALHRGPYIALHSSAEKKMWEFFTLPERALFGNHICFLCKYRK